MKVIIYFNTTCGLEVKEISNVMDICVYEDFIEISYNTPAEGEYGIENTIEIPRSIIDMYAVSDVSRGLTK